jgi:hypothetical protein
MLTIIIGMGLMFSYLLISKGVQYGELSGGKFILNDSKFGVN